MISSKRHWSANAGIRSIWPCWLICLITYQAYASETQNGQLFEVTKDLPRLERNQTVHDIDKIDTYTGALRISLEDVRLRGNGGLDIVVNRNYVPNMSYRAMIDSLEGMALSNKSHLFSEMGLGGGWSFAVAPKVIMNGATNKTILDDRLCTGKDWFRAGLKYGVRADGTSLVYYTDSETYDWSTFNEFTSYLLEHVNGQLETLVPTATGEVRTSSGWKLTCSAGNYLLHAPDGVKYEMNQRSEVRLNHEGTAAQGSIWWQRHASRIVDPNGNWIKIEYIDENYPSRITSSDAGVFLNFVYDTSANPGKPNPTLTEINDNGGRSWKYLVQDDDPVTDAGNVRYLQNNDSAPLWSSSVVRLKAVTLPDGTQWKYDYWGRYGNTYGGPSFAECAGFRVGAVVLPGQPVPPEPAVDNTSPLCVNGARSGLLKSQQYPTGGIISYDYQYSIGHHTHAWPWEYYYDLALAWPVTTEGNALPARFAYASRVKSRVMSTGPQWTYQYELSRTSGVYDKTTITTPNGVQTYKHIGDGYVANSNWVEDAKKTNWPYSDRGAWRIGLLAEKSIGDSYTEYNEWTPLVLSSFAANVYTGATLLADPNQTLMPALQKRRIVMNGATYLREQSGFDAYGAPGTVTESGPNGGNRTTTYTYLNDTAKWILSRPKNETFVGGSTIREFDGNGNLQSQSEGGVVTSYTYDAQGNIATKTLPRGLVHSYADYKRGIAQTETQPEGVSITRVVDGNGNLESETNGEGKTTRFAYDSMNRMTSAKYPVGNARSVSYTATSKTDTRGALVEETQLDGFGRIASVTRGGLLYRYTYDGFGHMTFASYPSRILGTGYQYDELGRLTRIENGDGSLQYFKYGAATKMVTDTRGKTTTYTMRSYSDPTQQFVMNIATPEPATDMAFTRNARDQVSTITQAGLTRSYGYNDNYYLTSVVNPETGTTIYGRDMAGNMTTRQVGAAAATIYTYDGQNREKTVTYPGATPAVSHTYNKLGMKLTSNAAGGNRSYGYDDNGNLISETLELDGLTLTAAFGYDGNDQLSTITYPRSGRVVSYAPDALGRPTQVSGYASGVSYWDSGLVRHIDFVNGTYSDYTEDSRMRPRAFEVKNATGGAVFASYVTQYDGMNNIVSLTDTLNGSNSRVMDYDGVNRLVTSTGPWGQGCIGYNGSGDITSQVLGTWNQYYAYSGGRLSSVSGSRAASYAYDDEGNIVSAAGNAYTYDSVPNLRCVNCNLPASKIEYQYDATNHRSKIVKAGVSSYEMYAANGTLLVEFTPGQPSKLVEYIYLGDKRIAQRVTQ